MSYERTLEQYKICLDMAEKVTERRLKTNNFYIGIISVLISAISVSLSADILSKNKTATLFLLWLFCLFICNAWMKSLDTYKKLNEVKFDIILEMEKELKHNCIACEWEKLKNEPKYTGLSTNEKAIPKLFGYIVSAGFVGYLLFL